jgi:predicted Zn-dependent peptidase
MIYKNIILNNGIRVVHQPSTSHVAHCGFIINTGTRDERPDQTGMAHLVEHMLFKGTKKRKAYHVLSRIEDIGGEIDAYTTKEETCVYASFLPEYFERAIELLTDIVFHSTYPARELKKEQEVIVEEIHSYLDSPAEWIFDEFESRLYRNHSLGHNILGDAENIKAFSSKDVISFVTDNYHTDQMVFTSVGNIPFNKLQFLLEKHPGIEPSSYRLSKRKLWKGNQVFNETEHRDTYQAHCIIGARANGYLSEKRFPTMLLANMLAGPGLNSRLNLLLREKHGLAYNIESNYTTYNETGNFNIYFGTENENVEKGLQLIRKEFNHLMQNKLGPIQLAKAKRQLIGQTAIGSEIQTNMLLSVGKSILLFDRVDPLTEMYKRIDEITTSEIIEVANELLQENNISTLICN